MNGILVVFPVEVGTSLYGYLYSVSFGVELSQTVHHFQTSSVIESDEPAGKLLGRIVVKRRRVRFSLIPHTNIYNNSCEKY